jgi:hypothetical protein
MIVAAQQSTGALIKLVRGYSPKLLSLLTFLFIFDHPSYSKNLKNYHIF